MAIIFQSTCYQGHGSSGEGEVISRFSKISFELIHFAQDLAIDAIIGKESFQKCLQPKDTFFLK